MQISARRAVPGRRKAAQRADLPDTKSQKFTVELESAIRPYHCISIDASAERARRKAYQPDLVPMRHHPGIEIDVPQLRPIQPIRQAPARNSSHETHVRARLVMDQSAPSHFAA